MSGLQPNRSSKQPSKWMKRQTANDCEPLKRIRNVKPKIWMKSDSFTISQSAVPIMTHFNPAAAEKDADCVRMEEFLQWSMLFVIAR